MSANWDERAKQAEEEAFSSALDHYMGRKTPRRETRPYSYPSHYARHTLQSYISQKNTPWARRVLNNPGFCDVTIAKLESDDNNERGAALSVSFALITAQLGAELVTQDQYMERVFAIAKKMITEPPASPKEDTTHPSYQAFSILIACARTIPGVFRHYPGIKSEMKAWAKEIRNGKFVHPLASRFVSTLMNAGQERRTLARARLSVVGEPEAKTQPPVSSSPASITASPRTLPLLPAPAPPPTTPPSSTVIGIGEGRRPIRPCRPIGPDGGRGEVVPLRGTPSKHDPH